jgi:(4S)-4-hydroxy-5-phosphonooxypentane-2,3-dione isomerase
VTADACGAAPAYAITVAFELEAGAFDEFHCLVTRNAAESVSSEPGCMRFDVLAPLDAGGQVLLYEIYCDRAAFDAHLATEHFKSFDESTRDLVRRKIVTEYRVAQNFKGVVPA